MNEYLLGGTMATRIALPNAPTGMPAVSVVGVPVAQGAAVPEVLITAESQYLQLLAQMEFKSTSRMWTLKPPPSKRPHVRGLSLGHCTL